MSIDNKVRVSICGKEYNLRTDDEPEYLIELAERVEKEINELIKLRPSFGVQNAAVFVALTSLDEAHKSQQSIVNVRTQIKAYVDDAAKARSEKNKLSEKINELEARISALEKNNAELEKDNIKLKKGNAELEKDNAELKKRAPLYEGEQLVMENTITPAVTVFAQESAEEEVTAAPKAGSSETQAEDNVVVAADKAVPVSDRASRSGKKETKNADKRDTGGRKNAQTGDNDRVPQQNGMTFSSMADFINRGKKRI